ncbi:MAG: hypothetical protein ACXABK_06870 [Candidatus Heimdallarchaeaceae archaeon]|jgi:hypothetical protein
MNKGTKLKASLCFIFILLALSPISNISKAKNMEQTSDPSIAQTDELIQAFNGNVSTTYVIRGEAINFFATIANFGEEEVTVLSLNAVFIHLEGLRRFNRRYTVEFDRDHRTIGPHESFTGTLREKIANPEAQYNVSIYFVAENVYDTTNELGAPALNYTAAFNITVRVVDFGSSSNVILGIGISFAIAVVVVIIIILYGWLRERMSKRKY